VGEIREQVQDVDDLLEVLADRAVKASTIQHADLEGTTLGKTGEVVMARPSSLRRSLPARTRPQLRGVATAAQKSESTKDFGDVPSAKPRRVVVTGVGMVTPLGYDVDSTWEAVLAGKTGIKKFTEAKFEGLPSQVAGYIPRGSGEGDFDGEAILGKKPAKEMAPFIQYAMVAANEAMNDANWHPEKEEDMIRTGVSLGSGIGGIEDITEAHDTKTSKGHRKISPRFIPKMLINLAGGQISMAHKAKGPNTAAVTACATGAHAIGDAFRFIKFGDADVMIAGGTESCVEPLSLGGFSQMKALATDRNDEPEKASRPFDESRSGFVMGEGAGVLVLEELEHAKARGAKMYAEIRGVGYTGDAFHVSAPSGEGGRRAMESAMSQGGLDIKDIDYINAHGTSTPVGDKMELETIQGLCGGPDNSVQPIVTSTKGATGHMLGAAGAVEAVFTSLSVAQDIIPPTLNLENPVISDGIKHVTGEKLKAKVDAALSNSFGFGGTNCCIAFSKPPPA
jgi:3-oxoacyl-[acyl-carrier-protein] synthase II